MSHLYREATVSSPAESVLIMGDNVLVSHHSTLLLYDHTFSLIRKRYFYEKILCVKKISDTAIVVLFYGNKLVQCDLEFKPSALRMVDGTDLYAHGNTCITHNTERFQCFNTDDEEIREFKFSSFGIYNMTCVRLMINYVPKLLIHSSEGSSVISVINLDGTPTKVETLDTLPDPVCFEVTERFIVVANRNFLQIKYRRESFVICLNQNLGVTMLKESLRQNVVEPKHDGNPESGRIFLERAVMVIKGDRIFILNGNGELFNFSLQMEPKKILGVDIFFLGRVSKPSSVDILGDLVCVGSLCDDTVLYRFQEDGELREVSRLPNIGIVTSFSSIAGRDMMLASGKGVYKASPCFEIQIYKKRKIDMKAVAIVSAEEGPVLLTEGQAFKIGQDLDLTEVTYEQRFRTQIMGEFIFSFISDGCILKVQRGEKHVRSFSGVSAWGFCENMLVLQRGHLFELIDLELLKPLFSSKRILEFDNDVYNEEMLHSGSLEEIEAPMPIEPAQPPKVEFSEKVCEVKMCKGASYYILFRTTKQLYVYRYDQRCMTKVWLNRPATFHNERQALFDLKDCVYCRSKHPCVLIFGKETHMYDIQLKLGYPVLYNGWIFSVFKGHLLKCRFTDISSAILSEDLIIKKLYTPDGTKGKYVRPADPEGVTSLVEDYREDPTIKHIISRDDCVILAVSRQVPFFYQPFIPMVHITDGPDGKPHSEPINKEEAEYVNKNPNLRGRTLHYSIELRSTDLKLISVTPMEHNEFICDIKIMFGSFLVICTSFPEGEDKMTKGKLTVYSLVNIVPDPMNPHITKKLKLICSETFKNPCLRSEEVRSLIAVCIGTKLMIYEFNENTGLAAVGRNEISLLCTSLFTTKNFIAVSDIMNGTYFFFLRPKDPLKLHLLGRSCQIRNCRFLGGIDYYQADNVLSLSLIAVSKSGTIQIFTYSPYDPVSKNGHQLIKRTEIATKLSNPLYTCAFGPINRFEYAFFSLNTMARIYTINYPKIQSIQHYISMFISDRCGINVRNYLETTEFVNAECKCAICEKLLLEFFYFKPEMQNKICELCGLDYFKVAALIESCLHVQKR